MVTVNINGEDKKIFFGINGIIELEKELGKPVTSIDDNLSFAEIRDMFYVGIKRNYKKLSKDEAGNMMDDIILEFGLPYLVEKILGAIQGSLGVNAVPSK